MKNKITIGLILTALSLSPGFASAASVDIVGQMSAMFSVALAVSAFIGVMLFANGLMGLHSAATGNSRKTYGSSLLNMVVGTFMLSVGWVYGLMKASFVGDEDGGVTYDGRGSLALDAAAIKAGGKLAATGFGKFLPAQTFEAIFAFVFLVGLLAFINGVYMLKNLSEGGDANMKRASFYRIIGGLMCMNLTWFSCLIGGFLGIASMCFGG